MGAPAITMDRMTNSQGKQDGTDDETANFTCEEQNSFSERDDEENEWEDVEQE